MMKIKMFIGALLLGLATGASAHHVSVTSGSASGAAAIDQSQHNASISTVNEAPDIPVATAYAPAMTNGPDDCQFTRASGGVQLPGAAASGAISEESEFCRKLRMAKLSAAMGDPAFGHEILCSLDDWKKASDAMGGMVIGTSNANDETHGHLVKAECTDTVKAREENEKRAAAGLEPIPAGTKPVDKIVFSRRDGSEGR